MRPARAQAPIKALPPIASTPQAPSREPTVTQTGCITALCEAPREPLLDSTLPEPAQASAMALPHGPSTTRVSSRESTWTQVRYRTASRSEEHTSELQSL